MAAHDADEWKEAVDKKMANKLGWACAGRSETEFLTKMRPGQSLRISTSALG